MIVDFSLMIAQLSYNLLHQGHITVHRQDLFMIPYQDNDIWPQLQSSLHTKQRNLTWYNSQNLEFGNSLINFQLSNIDICYECTINSTNCNNNYNNSINKVLLLHTIPNNRGNGVMVFYQRHNNNNNNNPNKIQMNSSEQFSLI